MSVMTFKKFCGGVRNFAESFPPEEDQFERAARVIEQRYAGGRLVVFGNEPPTITLTTVDVRVGDYIYHLDKYNLCVVLKGPDLDMVWWPTEAEEDDHCWLSVAMAAAIEGYHDGFRPSLGN